MNKEMIEKLFSKPVKKADLPRVLGCSNERAARATISRLAEEYNIVNFQDGKGYFLADNETAIKYAMQERKRGIASITKANKIIKRCEETGKYGIVIPVIGYMRRLCALSGNPNQIRIDDILKGRDENE